VSFEPEFTQMPLAFSSRDNASAPNAVDMLAYDLTRHINIIGQYKLSPPSALPERVRIIRF